MTVKDRIKMFVSHLKLTNQQFEVECGLSNGYIANIRKGIGDDALERISNKYPQLSKSWLLTGEGEMLKTSTPKSEPIATDNETRLWNMLESQQQTIRELSKSLEKAQQTINELTKSNGL